MDKKVNHYKFLNPFEKSKKALILKTMEEYKIPKGIRPTEEPVIEKGFEIEVPIAEEKEISNKKNVVKITEKLIEEKRKFINGESKIFDTLKNLPAFTAYFRRFRDNGFEQINAALFCCSSLNICFMYSKCYFGFSFIDTKLLKSFDIRE